MIATTTKKHPRLPLLTTAASLLLLATTPAARAASFSLSDNVGTPDAGSYTPGSSFTLSVTLNASNASAGYSLWFDIASANAGFLSITSFTLQSASFPDATSGKGMQSFDTANAGRPGFLSNFSDLGATTPAGSTASAGSYLVENVTFLIDPSAAPGSSFSFQTTPAASGGRASGSAGGAPGFTFDNAPSALYTVTVVPEPATYVMVMAGLLTLVGFQGVRRHRAARRLA